MLRGIGKGQELRGREWVPVPLMQVRECPEGIARRWDGVLEHALHVLLYGWPKRDWTKQDKRLIEAVDVVREVTGA